MEVYQTDDHYVLLDGDYTLWCSRNDGSLKAGKGTDLCCAWNPICLGVVFGVIGKIKTHPDSDWKLLLIKQKSLVGHIADENDIYQINKVAILSLSMQESCDLDLELCQKHHFGLKRQERTIQPDSQNKSLQKTWNTIKSAAENVKIKKKEVKDKEKFEKRILEELQKMFNESDSYYYSGTYDLTNAIQRQHQNYVKSDPLWKRTDERFFWNKYMLKELLDKHDGLSDHWILPIIQGYVQIKECCMDFEENQNLSPMETLNFFNMTNKKDPLKFWLVIISRRSRHRAGTRSKKRGLDETGACANYVETEQIIQFSPHLVSFVQIRGSVPVYWSQSGFKYRPPPKLDRGEKETQEAFEKHFQEQLDIYKKVAIVTLVELSGKERVISNAFLNHILEYNSPDLSYVTFDFHEYCRGMKFENVSILTDCLKDMIKEMHYSWVDNKGLICDQRGFFRINCVDCLDRTNVVQTAIARVVMETQCRKLGFLPPDETLPRNCRLTFQQLWANNGDAISRQYAGTAALKGDFTRTGERKITGMMKDGVNSANRYYLRFRDAYRQAAIDIMLGQPIAEDLLSLGSSRTEQEEDSTELLEKEENVRMLIDDLKRMLIVEPEHCIGGWSLVNADPVSGDPDRQEMDTILLLSQRAFYLGWYDDEEEQVTQYQRVFLEDIEKIEIGLEPSIFKSKYVCMRTHYHHYADEGFFHTLRTPSTRLFNNVVVAVRNQEEAKESLKAICQCFVAAQKIISLELQVVERQKLDRRKTKPHPSVLDIHKQLQENSLSAIKLPRNISASDLQSHLSRSPRLEECSLEMSNSSHLEIPDDSNVQAPERSKEKFQGKEALLSKFALPLKTSNLQFPKLNLNLMRKVKLGRIKFPAVFYSQTPGENLQNSLEKISIDVGQNASQEPNNVDDALLLGTPPSNTGLLLGKSNDSKFDVMLESCRILAPNPRRLLMSTRSLSDPDLKEAGKERQEKIWSASSTNSHGPKELMDRSLFLDLCQQKVDEDKLDMDATSSVQASFFMDDMEVCQGVYATENIEEVPFYPETQQHELNKPLKSSYSDGAISSHVEVVDPKFISNLAARHSTTVGVKATPRKSKNAIDLLKDQVLYKLQGRECQTRIIFI